MFKLFGLLLVVILLMLSLLGLSLAPVLAQDGEILFSKTANVDSAGLGETITYTYSITNNSTDNITGLSLMDNKLGTIAITDNLSAGDSITATASDIIGVAHYAGGATNLVNVATLTGNYFSSSDNSSHEISLAATENITLEAYEAALQVEKTASVSSADLNDVIIYTYTITNGGVVTISDIFLTDDKLGIITLSDNVTSLEPGQNAGATATYTVTVMDVLRGTVRNTAMVTGKEPNGSAVSASSAEVMVSTNAFTDLLTKAQILKARGVPGKGIDTAPGLQKPFNPNSMAIDNAGAKKGKGKPGGQPESGTESGE